MKYFSSKLSKIYLLFFVQFLLFSQLAAQDSPLRLWYESPANYWESYVPLGNGRLGAMPDGGIFSENIVLNDITLWSGAPQNADKPEAYKYLAEIQDLIIQGKNIEAQKVMSKHFVCEGPGSGGRGSDLAYGSYQILGNLKIDYDYGKNNTGATAENYMRDLTLNDAIASTQFEIGGIEYKREYFTSFYNDVVIVRLTSSGNNKINFDLSLTRPERFETHTEGNQLIMSGQLNNGTDGNGMKYIAKVEIKHNGRSLNRASDKLMIRDANSATIYISAKTNYKDENYLASCDKLLKDAIKKDYAQEKSKHIQNFQTLFNRASLNIAGDDRNDLPTIQRLQEFYKNPTDNGLINLYFQYGRYLLIGSTRAGLLPPNLQGLWANTIQTPWNGDYHLNINLQMNHWPVDITNLGMLNQPFFNLVKELVPAGEKTAQTYYEGKGWVAHVITNIWQFTSPGEHYSWGSFNSGSAWLSHMLWSHYEYSLSKTYLNELYPLLKGSSEFYLSTMIREPKNGWLVTSPSNSPENSFKMEDDSVVAICMGPTMDNQIIRALFQATNKAAEILDKDKSLREELTAAIKLIPPTRIDSNGRVMEWLEEYEEPEPQHRHISHLWGLYPGNEITSFTPDLLQASKATLERRGDASTGWSIAWKINFWARLLDGNRSLKLIQELLKPMGDDEKITSHSGGTYANLFCSHPPFQIDGNFGGTSGIAEMLIQSHEGYINLLPALPESWSMGSFDKLCVRGDGEVSLEWEYHKPTSMTLKANSNNIFKIKNPNPSGKIKITKDYKPLPVELDEQQFITLNLKKGDKVVLKFQ